MVCCPETLEAFEVKPTSATTTKLTATTTKLIVVGPSFCFSKIFIINGGQKMVSSPTLVSGEGATWLFLPT
jgi:TRAP-type mannitol/chloroaromatic compound transport system permease large subunit